MNAASPLIVVGSGPKNARTDPDTGLRWYTWKGIEYPSVTSIRNLAGMPHKLWQWRDNQVIARAMNEYQTLGRMLRESPPEATATWLRKAASAERDAAANLGTRVHDAAAAGKSPADVSADLSPFLQHYRQWLADSGAELVLVERQVFNLTVGYVGTFDAIVRFPKTNTYWMIDLKTGKGTYPEHALQLEAYARGEFIGEDDVVDDIATKYLQKVTGRAILHLRPEGYTFKVVPENQSTWVAFRGLLAFARWAHDHEFIDSLVTASKTTIPAP